VKLRSIDRSGRRCLRKRGSRDERRRTGDAKQDERT